ncbi:MAG TPA: TonB-dependent receptor plug domain-containing protein [Opitutaceae bacterium]|nr:TonB-dependent receptor plug domain-containing protein [Opitutaceae bacterium]
MSYKHVSAGSVLAALLSVALPRVIAQTAPAAGATGDQQDETIVLSPFVIQSSEDPDSYRATATLAGTRIRTDLRDVGSSISVVTSKFLNDTASRKAEDLLVYTPNTEVAAQGGNFLGQGDGSVLTGTNRASPVQNTRVRGLAEADNTRDFYLSDIPWDSYNVGRIDLQRGPNSILFGIGSPAGIVNASVNTAAFKDSNKVEAQLGSYGSTRFTGDFNKVLLRNQLAIRVSLLDDQTKYRQDPAFKNDRRAFIAGKWDPAFLNTDNMHTSIRANYETGKINSNLPRSTPPLDAITPWFDLGKPGYNAQTAQNGTEPPGGKFNAWLGAPGSRVFDGVVTAFNGTSQDFSYPAKMQPYPILANVPTDEQNIFNAAVGDNTLKGINTFNLYANAAHQIDASLYPYAVIGAYKAKSLTDRSVFDFYNNLIDGPNKSEFNKFHALNLAWSQTFLGDRLGYEVGYDHEKARFGYTSLLSNDATSITVDIMKTLIDGTPNPNFGRPVIIAGGGSAQGYWEERSRDVIRGTVFGEVNFADFAGKDSIITRIFGRNVFTGLLQRQENKDENRTYNRFYLADSFLPEAGQGSVGQATRDDIFYIYTGPQITASSAANLHLTGIPGTVTPQTSSTIRYYNNVTNAYEQIPLTLVNNDLANDDSKTYRLARKNNDTVKSAAIVWQGYWLDDVLVPMVGIRKDSQKFRDAGNPPAVPNNAQGKGGLVNPEDPSWQIPDDIEAVKLTSKTYSLVTHLPKQIRNKLPGNIDLSLIYNKSENFRPDSGRRDIRGNAVDNPKGETKEYGASIAVLDDKVTFKWIHYKTTIQNATLDSAGIGNQYLIGAVEAWGQAQAIKFRDSITSDNTHGLTVYGKSSDGHNVTWNPPSSPTADPVTGLFNVSQAELDATYAREKASVDAWFATQVPADFQQAWALTDYATVGGNTNFGASGLVVTGTTISKGDEFELSVSNVVRGLDVVFNASKTHATRTDIAQSYVDWITTRWAQFQGPAGDMRLWGQNDEGPQGGETAKGKYGRETMAGYNLFKALEGADVPELKPWAFNVIANYSFQSGGPLSSLKGFSVGGSFRWIDKSVTGFPVIADTDPAATGPYKFDVEHPYKGSAEATWDFWLGYQRKLTSKINWKAQFNVRNAFANDDLIKVTVQPDGSGAAYRIPEPRTWTFTNTFEF